MNNQPVNNYNPAPQQPIPEAFRKYSLNQLKPLSAWAYFGLSLLFSVPIVGLVFLIVFSCSSANINRRSFARSYWCGYILVAVVVLIFFICGGSFAALEAMLS